MAIVVPIETKYNPRGVKTAIRNLDDFRGAVDKAGGGMRGFGIVTGKVMQNVGRSISNTGSQMTRSMTLPIVGLGIASAVAFDKVDSGLDTVAARSGRTGAELVDLQTVFKVVAESATQDMEEVAEVVGRVGGKWELSGKQAQIFATKILDMARITGGDGVAATESIGKALTAFGIPARKSSGFLDALLVASQKSNVSVDSLASTVAKAAPTFKTYGFNARESVAIVSSLEGAGLPATRVVSGLNAAFKKFAEAGVKDVPGHLTKVLEKIRDMPNATKATSLAVDLFGSKVGVVLADAIRSGKVPIEDLTGALDGSKGALDRAAAAVEGPQEKFARLKNQLLLVGAAFMEALIPALEMILPYIKQAIDWFKGLDDSQRKIIVVVGLVVAAIGPLLMVLGGAITAIGGIVAAVAAISGPVLIAIAVIAGIIAVVVLLWNKSEAFRDAVIKVWDTVKAAIASAIDSVKAKIEENREKLEKLRDAFSKVWDFIQTYVIPVLAELYGTYLKTLIGVLGWVIGKIVDFVAAIVDFYQGCYDAGVQIGLFYLTVKEKIGAAIDWIADLDDKIIALFSAAGTWLLEAGKSIVQGLWNGITGVWDSMVGWLEEKVDALPDAVKSILHINSPSKVFIPIGESIPEGLASGIRKAGGKPIAESVALARRLAKMTAEQLDALLANLTGKRDAAQARLDTLKAWFERARGIIVDAFAQMKAKASAKVDELAGELDRLKTEASTFAASIKSSFAIAFSTDGEGSVLDRFRAGISDGVKFVAQIRQLRDLGLNDTSLQNIITAGVEQGKKIADSLLSSDGAIGEVNSLQAAYLEQVDTLGAMLSDDKFGKSIVEAQSALETSKAAYAEIVSRETAALAQLDALALRFGIQTDAMTQILDDGAARITALLSDEDMATTLLTGAVTLVTDGLLGTADALAVKASALTTLVAGLEARITTVQNAIEVQKVAGAAVAAVAGAAGKIPKRAMGGSTVAGQTYWVGERGPELWTAGADGFVTPNNRLGGSTVTIERGAIQVTVEGGDPVMVQAVVHEEFARLVRELRSL